MKKSFVCMARSRQHGICCNYDPTVMDIDAICAIMDRVRTRLSELTEDEGDLLATLCAANRSGMLGAFLASLGLEDNTEMPSCQAATSAKILVIGESMVKEKDIWGMAKTVFKDCGISFDKRRFELHLEYEDCKAYPFEKLRYNDAYSVVFIGPGPHSVESNGDYYSVITRMEQEEGFPPVVRLYANRELKITKTNFREKLSECISKGLIQ